MYLRWLFYGVAVVQLVFGVTLLLVPQWIAAIYGATYDATSLTLAAFRGAAVLPLALVSWTAARTPGSVLKLALVRGLALVAVADFVVTWSGLGANVFPVAGAIANFAIAGIFIVGFGYYGWLATQHAST